MSVIFSLVIWQQKCCTDSHRILIPIVRVVVERHVSVIHFSLVRYSHIVAHGLVYIRVKMYGLERLLLVAGKQKVVLEGRGGRHCSRDLEERNNVYALSKTCVFRRYSNQS